MSIFVENPVIESENWAIEKLYNIYESSLINKETGDTYETPEALYESYVSMRENIYHWVFDTAKINNVSPESYTTPQVCGRDIIFYSQFVIFLEKQCQNKLYYKGHTYYDRAWYGDEFEAPLFRSYFDWITSNIGVTHFSRNLFEDQRRYECIR